MAGHDDGMAWNSQVAVPTARDGVRPIVDVHAPKVELFDVEAMTNTDPKGFVRSVDVYRLTASGLYMARPVPGHPKLAYFRSWLLPELGLRVSRWSAREGVELDHDYYIDVVDIQPGAVWRTVDLYLDILVRTGRDQRVLDSDELVAAVLAGHIDAPAAQRALEHTNVAVDGIAAHGYHPDEWLATLGHPVDWTN
jgi:hypothetical protein